MPPKEIDRLRRAFLTSFKACPVIASDHPIGHRRTSRRLWTVIAIVALSAAAFFIWRLPAKQERRVLVTMTDLSQGGRGPGDPYIGSRVCGECHPGEYASYTGSGHARTFRAAELHRVARRLDGRTVADPEIPGVAWSFGMQNGRLGVVRKEGGHADRLEFDYALGSGHHATTFVTVLDADKPAAFEHRLTYLAREARIIITPGQRAAAPSPGTTPRGRALSTRETIKCFACHSTQSSARPDRELDEATLIPNVSCERCHGPARAHVVAARRGRQDLVMPFGLGQWTAESQMKLCGQCHRHPSRAPEGLILPEDGRLARFQPVGLMQSKCFTASGGGLSCVNCHDPHARAVADRRSYEAACLQCHAAAPQAVCPTSPRSGCIDCHMPRVDTGQRVLFTDHWIRVRREPPAEPPKPSTEGETAPFADGPL